MSPEPLFGAYLWVKSKSLTWKSLSCKVDSGAQTRGILKPDSKDSVIKAPQLLPTTAYEMPSPSW